MDFGVGKTKKQTHKNILKAFDAAAKELGNTGYVCRKYYIHPFVVASYEDGSIQKSFEDITNNPKRTPNFTATETAILELLQE